jgi:hypothetical protein
LIALHFYSIIGFAFEGFDCCLAAGFPNAPIRAMTKWGLSRVIPDNLAYSSALSRMDGSFMGQRWLDGYSAEVELYLLIDGERIDIAQIADGSIILRDPYVIQSGTSATLVIKIDGHEEREEIVLKSSAENNRELVTFF